MEGNNEVRRCGLYKENGETRYGVLDSHNIENELKYEDVNTQVSQQPSAQLEGQSYGMLPVVSGGMQFAPQYVDQWYKAGLGYLQAQQVTPIDIETHVKLLISENKVGASSIGKVVDVLNAAYEWAIRQGDMQQNPVRLVKTELSKKLKKLSVKGADEADVVALSDEEIKLFEQEATELHANGHEKYPAGMYCLLLLHTGMRVGEMIALRWRDWKGDYLVIEKSVSTAKNRNKKSEDENNYISLEGNTKNQKARNIQLNKEAKYILWKLKHSRESCEPDDLIVPTKTGKMNTASNLEHRMKVIMKNAGLEDVKGGLHIFRKTFATKMYENGARVEEIAAYIGDLPSTTQKYYIAIRRKVVADGETHQIVKLPGSKAGEEPVA